MGVVVQLLCASLIFGSKSFSEQNNPLAVISRLNINNLLRLVPFYVEINGCHQFVFKRYYSFFFLLWATIRYQSGGGVILKNWLLLQKIVHRSVFLGTVSLCSATPIMKLRGYYGQMCFVSNKKDYVWHLFMGNRPVNCVLMYLSFLLLEMWATHVVRYCKTTRRGWDLWVNKSPLLNHSKCFNGYANLYRSILTPFVSELRGRLLVSDAPSLLMNWQINIMQWPQKNEPYFS